MTAPARQFVGTNALGKADKEGCRPADPRANLWVGRRSMRPVAPGSALCILCAPARPPTSSCRPGRGRTPRRSAP